MDKTLTATRLRDLLHYDAETGSFSWIKRTGNQATGRSAGTPHKEYVRIQVDGRLYRAHRLAWLYMTGEWPSSELDHINGVGSDNRWENLRLATRKMNMQNKRRAHKSSTTGLLGVTREVDGHFRARIRFQGKVLRIPGGFDTPEEAHAAYLEAKRKLHEGNTL